MTAPIIEVRKVSAQWRPTSRQPSHTSANVYLAFDPVSSALNPFRVARPINSGTANIAITAVTASMPSHRKSCHRCNAARRSSDRASRMKSSAEQPNNQPLEQIVPLKAAIKVMPSTARRKNSAGLKAKTMGPAIGNRRLRNMAPMTPPTPEAASVAPRARPASPFWAMG